MNHYLRSHGRHIDLLSCKHDSAAIRICKENCNKIQNNTLTTDYGPKVAIILVKKIPQQP